MLQTTMVYFAFTHKLEDKALFEKLYQAVSPERQQKITRLVHEEDKRLSLGAACLLKRALADCGASYSSIEYASGGKPYLAGCRNMFFNLSHSKDIVLCALSPLEVGCDVEKVGGASLAVAQRYFSPEEYHEIMKISSPEEQRLLFYRMWTLKESYIKATGQGLQMPLDGFRVQTAGKEITILQNGERLPYYFNEYEPETGYRCAVCSRIPEFGGLKQISLQ